MCHLVQSRVCPYIFPGIMLVGLTKVISQSLCCTHNRLNPVPCFCCLLPHGSMHQHSGGKSGITGSIGKGKEKMESRNCEDDWKECCPRKQEQCQYGWDQGLVPNKCISKWFASIFVCMDTTGMLGTQGGYWISLNWNYRDV